MDRVPLPLPRCPLTDERTGLLAREWYLFFLSLLIRTDKHQDSIVFIQTHNNVPVSWDGGDSEGDSAIWTVPGVAGRDGADGTVGVPGQDGQDAEEYVIPGRGGLDGQDGLNGLDGRPGIDAEDGSDGWPGPPGPPGPASANFDLDKVLVLLADGNPISNQYGNLMEVV